MEFIVFLLTSVFLFVAVFFIINHYTGILIYSIIITISTYLSYVSIVSILYTLINIKITPITISILNALLFLLIYMYTRKKKIDIAEMKSKLSIDLVDCYAIVLSIAISTAIFIKLYSLKLSLRFLTTDPAVHFIFSKYFSENGKLLLSINELLPYKHMSSYPFLAYVNTGLWMSATTETETKVIIYLISNVLLFFLILLSVYAIYKKYVAKTDYLQTTIIIIAASIGYNLNGIIFGFTSQMAGIFIALTLILIAEIKWKPYLVVILFSINLIGLFYSYYYFIPAGALALIVSKSLIYEKNIKNIIKSIFEKRNIIIGFIVLIFGFLYIIVLNPIKDHGNIESIKYEGFIYRDLYSSFKPFMLFAIVSFFYWFKTKKNNAIHVNFIFYTLFAIVIFCMGMSGEASSYYFYKNHYLLENLIIILFCLGLYYVKSSNKIIYYSFICLLVFLCINTFFLDKPIQKNNELFNAQLEENLTKVQSFNRDISKSMETIYSKEQRSFLDYIEKNKSFLMEDNEYLPVVGTLLQRLWFYSYTSLWPQYNSKELAAVYQEKYFVVKDWEKDLNKTPFVILFQDYNEWLSSEGLNTSDYEIVYEVKDAVLLKYIK